MMNQVLPRQNWRWASLCASAGALLLAGLLFLLIPLTQMFDKPAKPDLTVREVRIGAPPPPPQAPPPETEQPPPPEPVMTELPQEPSPVELQPLDVSLSPGSGDAIAMGAASPAFEMDRDVLADLQQMFTFDDLAEAPRLLSVPDFRFPAALARRGVAEGKVVVEIDILPNGTARFRRIVSSSHRELEPIAERIVARARFTEPTVDGQAQTVRGRFPLILQQ